MHHIFKEFAFKLAFEIRVSFLILITVPAALIVSYYTLLEYLGTIQVSCDVGNKFRSDIIAIIPGCKYLISVSVFF